MKKIFLISTIIISLCFFVYNISFEAAGDEELYLDYTITNLPVSGVTGPSMDCESADIDGDGDLDIILAREFAPNKLLINNGKGIFTDGTIGRLPQFNYDSEDIGVADFDNDSDMDIVFASEDNAVHEFYLNDGTGHFRNANDRLPNSIANAVIARDINNDNRPDIILGNDGQDLILINNGDTTFTNQTSTRLPASADVTQDIKLADIDDDNDNDLIAGNEEGNKIYINDGNGFFTDETSSRLPLTGTEETRKVSLADVDNDSDLDIFFANVAFRPGRIRQDRLLLNNGAGVFTDVTTTNLPPDEEHTTEGIFLDIDFDNDVDLITSNIFFNRPMKVFENNGTGIFTEVTKSVLPPNVFAEGIGLKAADLNHDGLQDIYLVNRRTNQQTTETDRLLIRKDTTKVGIYLNENNIPSDHVLYQNYPNPFNPSTSLNYKIRNSGWVNISLYDINGRKISTLMNEYKGAGEYKLEFTADNKTSSGIYFVKMEAGDFSSVIKMVLNK